MRPQFGSGQINANDRPDRRAACVMFMSNGKILFHDAAINPFWRQMARHVVKPEPSPGSFDLSKVFGLVHQLIGPGPRVAGILVQHAAGIDQPPRTNGQHGDTLNHLPPPCEDPMDPDANVIRCPIPQRRATEPSLP